MALLHKIGQSDSESVYDAYAQKPSEAHHRQIQNARRFHDPEVITDLILDELLLDGNAKQNLSTFCQTYADPYIRKIMDACIDKNMIDKDEYPQTAEIERRCVQILADLWNSPESKTTIGCSTIEFERSRHARRPGHEMEMARKNGRKKRKTNRQTEPHHGSRTVCWEKFARYFDVELREIPMEHDRLLMTPEEVIKRIDENTIGVVPTFGVTFTLQYEPVKEIKATRWTTTRSGRGSISPSMGRCQRRFHRPPSHPAGISYGISACRA